MLNILQLDALNKVKEGKSIFLTGAPGVGKSFLLSKIVEYLKETDIKYGITALTGCAALLIKGQTLHSFLGIGLGNSSTETLVKKIEKNGKVYNKIKELQLLIIDEISMMNDIFFEKISCVIKSIKKNNKPFGNIQLVLVGDFCQLPPVDSKYCFESKLWKELNIIKIELKEIIRQKDDNDFQTILNSIRNGKITKKSYNKLLSLQNTEFNNSIIPTKLYCLNIDVDKINNNNFDIQYCTNINLDLLDKNNDLENIKINNTIDCYYGQALEKDNIDIPDNEKIYRYNCYTNDKKTDKTKYNISLIKNLQVMVNRNINLDLGLVNGTRGIITSLNEKYVIIKDINNNLHKIDYYRDGNDNDLTYNIFIPLSLAYSLTVHKAQGCTLDAVEIDASNNNFAPGQLYTALSRAKKMENIKLVNLDKEAFLINKNVLSYYNNN
jgi:ATP-dependent DNA helicase PIF1|uniref:AAA+ ATPase domain-containing protein n=1 Tax=viral metagenome TaxID=1070528 RepID=A0A6C0JMZ2_9ZZZZ